MKEGTKFSKRLKLLKITRPKGKENTELCINISEHSMAYNFWEKIQTLFGIKKDKNTK